MLLDELAYDVRLQNESARKRQRSADPLGDLVEKRTLLEKGRDFKRFNHEVAAGIDAPGRDAEWFRSRLGDSVPAESGSRVESTFFGPAPPPPGVDGKPVPLPPWVRGRPISAGNRTPA